MNNVRIYPQSKSQTQSGRCDTGHWVIEPELISARHPEPVMGWTSSGDTLSQLRLEFSSQEEAEAFAKSNGWRYTLSNAHQRKVRPRNYGQNYIYNPDDEK